MSPNGAETLFAAFLRAVVASVPPEARVGLILELRKWAGKTVYFPAGRRAERREAVARSILQDGVSPADAARIMCERVGCSLRQAQRYVKTARHLSHARVAVGPDDGGPATTLET